MSMMSKMSEESGKKGWLFEGLAEAKPIKNHQTNSAAKDPMPQPQKEEVAKPQTSLRDRLLVTTKSISSAQALKTTIADASDCQTNPSVIRGFVELVDQADELAIYTYGQSMPGDKAEEKWMDMDWAEQEAQFKEWADSGNEMAKTILDGLASFGENILLRDFLREIVTRIVTPVRQTRTFNQLHRFLDEMVDDELAKPVKNPNHFSQDDVVVPKDGVLTLYVPYKGVKVAEGGWMFVKEAMARIKTNENKLEGLRSQATEGLTPYKVSRGETGTLFVRLSAAKAVLLEVFDEAGWQNVRVVGSEGVDDDQLPSDAVLWDDKAHKTQGSGKWAWINKSLEQTAEYQRRSAVKARNERDDRLTPLASIATLPWKFEEQGLTRMIRGEQGILALYSNRFRWGNKGKVGFFGFALQRDGDKFVLVEVVSDFQFPKTKLVGQFLPLTWDEAKPEINLKTIRVEPDMFNGLKMVEVLLKLRLGAEIRAVERLPNPKENEPM